MEKNVFIKKNYRLCIKTVQYYNVNYRLYYTYTCVISVIHNLAFRVFMTTSTVFWLDIQDKPIYRNERHNTVNNKLSH